MFLSTPTRLARPTKPLSTCIVYIFALAILMHPAHAVALSRRDTIKIMVVGDSISHGHEGDYTWRYRLSQWFQLNNIAVDFVGPYSGTDPQDEPKAPQPPTLIGQTTPSTPLRFDGGYAAGQPAFDSDHFAAWGRQTAQDMGQIANMVTTYQPDFLLVELGFNDLGWFVSGPEGTLQSMQTFITNVRSAKPNIKLAIANVPFRTYIGGRDDLPIITDQYNKLLANAIPQWSTTQSPIYPVLFRENYQCELNDCPAGHDGLHPNVLGEYQIAQAFTKTLYSNFKLGSGPLSIPATMPIRPCGVPANFKATTAASGVVVTWDEVYGAYGYQVRQRLVGQDWTIFNWTSSRWDTTSTVDGQQYEYLIRTDCGNQPGGYSYSAWTSQISATAHPQTLPGPKNIHTFATNDGFKIAFDPVPGATLYGISYFDEDTPGYFVETVGTTGNSATLTGLTAGHHYVIAVATWSSAGAGFPSVPNGVSVGQGTPPPPTNLQVYSIDPTTVQLTWTGSEAAFGYNFWIRNINNASDYSKSNGSSTSDYCHGIAFLFPGVWNYEFCVSAYNGDVKSGKSNCVIPTKNYNANAGTICPVRPTPTSPSQPPTTPSGSGGIFLPSSTPTPTGLGPRSSCQDLENFQGLAPDKTDSSKHLKAAFWDMTDTTSYFKDWVSKNKDEEDFEEDFASSPWGIGQSFSSCDITVGNCARPDCNGFGTHITDPYGAAAYQIIVSMANVNMAFQKVWTALKDSATYFGTMQTAYESSFDTAEGPQNSNLWISELVNAIATVVGIGLALTGDPIAAAVGVFAAGVSSGVSTGLSEDKVENNPTDNMAHLALAMTAAFDSSKKSIAKIAKSFISTGEYTSPNGKKFDFVSAFGGGVWEDFHSIPLLQQDDGTSAIDTVFTRHVDAMAINWAWHRQRVWVMSYPMTQSDFENTKAFAGSNDSRLKLYYKGRGFFFQSVFPQKEALSSYEDPRMQNPPGWAEVFGRGFTTWDIMQSSYDGFMLGGYGYSPETDFASIVTDLHPQQIIDSSVSLPGIFTIAQCVLDSSHPKTPDLQSFFNALAGPGALWTQDDQGDEASLCFCLGLTDKNGKKFEDYIDVGGWATGSNPFCGNTGRGEA